MLREAIENVLGITGAMFVDEEAFEAQPATELEEFLREQVVVYTPYLLSEPAFDKSNLNSLVNGDQSLECPIMDVPALEKLFSYAVDSKWGRKKIA